MGDSGITSHEYDNTFAPLLKQLDSTKSHEAWKDSNPKVWGVVSAQNMLEAERVAFTRARLTIDLINFALNTGMSHFETRYETEPLPWDGEDGLTPVSFHPWIVMREVKTGKGWARQLPASSLVSENKLDDCIERIQFFVSRFLDVHQAGSVHAQLSQMNLTKRERRLFSGIQRSLRWLNLASGEEDLNDQFVALWTALESILNSAQYPGVFDGDRANIRDKLRSSIKNLALPARSDDLLAITSTMLDNRILRGDWPTVTKLFMFARAFGINLQPDDLVVVRNLAAVRGAVFHAGDDDPNLSKSKLRQLKYLIERLVVATSIGGYEDLESRRHHVHFGQIGPEGGPAPMFIDGREVTYDFYLTASEDGPQRGEWVAEGKIHLDKDLDFI